MYPASASNLDKRGSEAIRKSPPTSSMSDNMSDPNLDRILEAETSIVSIPLRQGEGPKKRQASPSSARPKTATAAAGKKKSRAAPIPRPPVLRSDVFCGEDESTSRRAFAAFPAGKVLRANTQRQAGNAHGGAQQQQQQQAALSLRPEQHVVYQMSVHPIHGGRASSKGKPTPTATRSRIEAVTPFVGGSSAQIDQKWRASSAASGLRDILAGGDGKELVDAREEIQPLKAVSGIAAAQMQLRRAPAFTPSSGSAAGALSPPPQEPAFSAEQNNVYKGLEAYRMPTEGGGGVTSPTPAGAVPPTTQPQAPSPPPPPPALPQQQIPDPVPAPGAVPPPTTVPAPTLAPPTSALPAASPAPSSPAPGGSVQQPPVATPPAAPTADTSFGFPARRELSAAERAEMQLVTEIYKAAHPKEAAADDEDDDKESSAGTIRKGGNVIFPTTTDGGDAKVSADNGAWRLYATARPAPDPPAVVSDDKRGAALRATHADPEVDYHEPFQCPIPQSHRKWADEGAITGASMITPESATLAAQAVMLTDPMTLLASEHLLEEATGIKDRSDLQTRIIQEAFDFSSKGFDSQGAAAATTTGGTLRTPMLLNSVLMPVPPPGEVFCTLSYAAKVLLSALLYIRTLGGFPTLLRAGPLTDMSPVVDKENCVELVFWNPASATASAPPPTLAATAHNNVAAPFSKSAAGAGQGSILEQTLASRFKGLSDGKTPQRQTRVQLNATDQPMRAGREQQRDAGVPVMDPADARHSRRRSSSVFSAQTEISRSEQSNTTTTQVPLAPGGGTQQISPALLRGLIEGSPLAHLSSSGSIGQAAAGPELPSTPTKAGKPLIKEGTDELCIVLRAVLAQKSQVHRFGQSETVHVLPPLPTEEEDLQKQLTQDMNIGGIHLANNNPLFKFLNNSAGKQAAADRHSTMLEQRKKRQAARGPVTITEDGKSSADDYGDLVVAMLLSGEASQLTGSLPDAMEIEALRYRIFSLQGYSVKDPYGISRKPTDPADEAGATADSPLSHAGDSVLSSARPPRKGSSFMEELSQSFGIVSPAIRSRSAQQQQKQRITSEEVNERQRIARERSRRHAMAFPLYRASSVAESTLKKYHAETKEARMSRRAPAPTPAAPAAAAALDAASKRALLKSVEKDLALFRPFNLNGFYGEISDAVQYALDMQLRQTKEKVMQAFHM